MCSGYFHILPVYNAKHVDTFIIIGPTIINSKIALALTFAPGAPVGPLAPRPPRGPYIHSI